MTEPESPLGIESLTGGVTVLTIERPKALNAISTRLAQELARAVVQAGDDTGCLVVTGAGDRAFGAGLDLRELERADPQQRAAQQNALLEMQRTLAESRIPLVAAVNGLALGASWQLALHCDVVLAAETAQFGMPEISAGQPCIIGSWLLGTSVSASVVADVVLAGHRITAREARALGLVGALVPRDRLLEESVAYARTLASRRSPAFDGTRAWMRRLRYQGHGGFDDALRHADRVLAQNNLTPKEHTS